jgi:hypothetical protein
VYDVTELNEKKIKGWAAEFLEILVWFGLVFVYGLTYMLRETSTEK